MDPQTQYLYYPQPMHPWTAAVAAPAAPSAGAYGGYYTQPAMGCYPPPAPYQCYPIGYAPVAYPPVAYPVDQKLYPLNSDAGAMFQESAASSPSHSPECCGAQRAPVSSTSSSSFDTRSPNPRNMGMTQLLDAVNFQGNAPSVEFSAKQPEHDVASPHNVISAIVIPERFASRPSVGSPRDGNNSTSDRHTPGVPPLEMYIRDMKESPKRDSRRKRKDPTAPKNPLSAYLYFVTEQRTALAQNNASGDKVPGQSNPSFSAVARELGQRWKSMTEEERRPYVELAKKDKERYEAERLAFGKKKVFIS